MFKFILIFISLTSFLFAHYGGYGHGNLPKLNQDNTFTGLNTFSGANTYSGLSTFTGNVSITGQILGNLTGYTTDNTEERWGMVPGAIGSADGGFFIRDKDGALGAYIRMNNVTYFSSRGGTAHPVAMDHGIVIGGTAIDADSSQWIDDATQGSGTTTMYIGNNTIDVTAPSDAKLKEILGDAKNQTERLMALNAVEFIRKATGGKEIGLIAQEVEKIYPEYVFEDAKGFKRIKYKDLITPLLIGFQEQQKQINKLMELIK